MGEHPYAWGAGVRRGGGVLLWLPRVYPALECREYFRSRKN
jgi:hypothetical protein